VAIPVRRSPLHANPCGEPFDLRSDVCSQDATGCLLSRYWSRKRAKGVRNMCRVRASTKGAWLAALPGRVQFGSDVHNNQVR